MVESIKELRKICQRDVDLDIYSFYRYFSIYLTKLFLYTPITPNQITLVRIIVGLLAGFFLILNNNFIILGGLFMFVSDTLDYSDGEVARYRGLSSISGLYFDRMSSAITHPYYFICLSIGVFKSSNNFILIILGISSALSDSLKTIIIYGMYISVVDVKIHPRHANMGGEVSNAEKKSSGLILLRKDLESKFSIIYYILDILYNRALGMTPLFIVTIIYDLLFSPYKIGSFYIGAKMILLMIYGISGPFICMITMIMILKNKHCEKLYQSLFY